MRRAERRHHLRRIKARWLTRLLRFPLKQKPAYEAWARERAPRYARHHGYVCGHTLADQHRRRHENRRARREARAAVGVEAGQEVKVKAMGEKVKQMLRGLTEGECIHIDGVEWMSIGDKFAVEADEEGMPAENGEELVYVGLDELDDYFDDAAEFEVAR